MSDYPEHEKLSEISGKSHLFGEFLDWLKNEQGVHFMRISHTPLRERYEEDQPWYQSERPVWVEDGRSILKLLLQLLQVNAVEVGQEKRAMLEKVCKDHAVAEASA